MPVPDASTAATHPPALAGEVLARLARGRGSSAGAGGDATSPWQRLARHTAAITALDEVERICAAAVAAVRDLTPADAAAVVVVEEGVPAVRAGFGALHEALREAPHEVLEHLAAEAGRRCDDAVGAAVTDDDPDLGALTWVPLCSAGEVMGFLLAVLPAQRRAADAGTADAAGGTAPAALLEALCAQVASALHAVVALEAVRRRAGRDALTGLGHGVTFHEHLAAALHEVEHRTAVLLIDVDNLRHVNDTRGHAQGDSVLVECAEVVAGALRASDRLYRVGGDEFAAILQVDSPAEALRIARRISRASRQPGRMRVSVGVTVVGADLDTGAVLAEADLALREAKRRAGPGVTLFEPDLRAAALERAQLAGDLELALERGELHLEYQPIVSLGDTVVRGVEALARWTHPERGMVPPTEFIPVAEESGLVGQIGRWVLDQACAQLAAWEREGWAAEDLHLAVNVSARELGPDTVRAVRAATKRHGIAPHRLVIEVTESVFIDERDATGPLQRLRELGVQVAVDDFGTGYSSLSYLHRLPIDILKIDRSFVADLTDVTNVALAGTIIELGRVLGLSIVAEGIEDTQQAQRLRLLGCEHAQGYLWSRPVKPGELAGICRRFAESA
jgi:diguanylate cyclase (GGDEF)-like protein